MSVFLRKAFKAGPVRLNLSKSGFGLSGGVTGARIGIGPAGPYVHGGRHGIYYRKYASRGKRNRQHSGQATAAETSPGKVDLFRDTGVTLTSERTRKPKPPALPEMPASKVMTRSMKWATGIGFAGLFFSILSGSAFAIVWLILLVPLLIVAFRNKYWHSKAGKWLGQTADNIEAEPEQAISRYGEFSKTLPEKWQDWLAPRFYAVSAELAMRLESLNTQEVLNNLNETVALSENNRHRIQAFILSDILDTLLEDYMLSEDEEKTFRELITISNLPETYTEAITEILDHYGELRTAVHAPLRETDAGIPLVKGEKAYEVFEPCRQLNERVLNRFQRDNIQYRELGYEIDLEGKLVLTDRRLLIIGKGSREYRLNRLLDVIADPASGLTELVLSGRKSPVILSVTRPLVLASRLELIGNEVTSGE